jgi:hypothetical protein
MKLPLAMTLVPIIDTKIPEDFESEKLVMLINNN